MCPRIAVSHNSDKALAWHRFPLAGPVKRGLMPSFSAPAHLAAPTADAGTAVSHNPQPQRRMREGSLAIAPLSHISLELIGWCRVGGGSSRADMRSGQQCLCGAMNTASESNVAPYFSEQPEALDHQDLELFLDLLATRAVQRLKAVSFLGSIDYSLVPSPNGALQNARHTRYHHSVGVASLATVFAEQKGLLARDRQHGLAAALLHDLGHAPLSHSLEPVFRRNFGMDHHSATENIIRGSTHLSQDVLAVFRKHKIDAERVLGIINGGENDLFLGVFGGPINLDTIEGIMRTYTYISGHKSGPSPADIVRATVRRQSDGDQRLVDEFWLRKDIAYRLVINSPGGVLADAVSQFFMSKYIRNFCPADFYRGERALREKVPGLVSFLRERYFEYRAFELLDICIEFTDRAYFIDEGIDFFGRNDMARYAHKRQKRFLRRPQRGIIEEKREKQGDLFDDYGLYAGSVREKQAVFR